VTVVARGAARVARLTTVAGTSLALLLLLGNAALLLLGGRLLVVTSGSMAPAIAAGDAIVVRPVDPDLVAVGDVVTFRPPGGGGLVTHRVVAIDQRHGARYLRTRGDANEGPDADLASAAAVQGRTVAVLPGAGRVLVLLTGRARWLLLGAAALALAVREGVAVTRHLRCRSGSTGGTAP